MTELIQNIESILGRPLKTLTHLDKAMIHRSYAHEQMQAQIQDNERLEFLGDAVLELVVSEALIEKFPDQDEGILSKYRSSLVNETTLNEVAGTLCLQAYLKLGKGEAKQRGTLNPSIMSDAMEAVFGAVFLSESFDGAKQFILKLLQPWFEKVHEESFNQDFKSELQEHTLKVFKVIPKYRVVSETGPDHSKTFVTEVSLHQNVLAQGQGRSKKHAEIAAAKIALLKIQSEEE